MVFSQRTLGIIFLWLGVGLMTAAGAQNCAWVKGVYVAESPLPLLVPAASAQSVAQAKARECRGVAVPAKGNSMLPLYQHGVIMVVAPADYDELKRGQTVVYENSHGRIVAHILVAKTRQGWRVTGLNNRTHDGEGVNARNLRGIVVDAIQPMGGVSVALR